MGMLTRADIAALQEAAPPLVIETVKTPEWGDDAMIYVKALTVTQAELYEQRHVYPVRQLYNALYALGEIPEKDAMSLKLENMEAWEAQGVLAQHKSSRIPLIVLTACDAEGTLLFTDEDAEWLERQPPRLIKRIYDAAWTLNGFGEEALKAAEKNSGSIQSNDSGTDLRSNGVIQMSSV